MLCPKGMELEKNRADLYRSYMEMLNPGTPWKTVSRPKIEQMTLAAKERYDFAEKMLNNHKQECKVCTWP
jgi:hypothetical protein